MSLKEEFNKAKSNGWIEYFNEAANFYKWPIEVLLGIASRETNMNNIVGDFGHGYGIMQVDIGTEPEFCKSGEWRDVRKAILKGTEILTRKRDQLLLNSGKNLSLRDRSGKQYFFVVPNFLSDEELLRLSIADYNSGLWAAYHASKGRDPDRGTTGANYSRDVLNRASEFKKFLEG